MNLITQSQRPGLRVGEALPDGLRAAASRRQLRRRAWLPLIVPRRPVHDHEPMRTGQRRWPQRWRSSGGKWWLWATRRRRRCRRRPACDAEKHRARTCRFDFDSVLVQKINHDRPSGVYVGPSPPSNTMELQVQPQPFQPVVAGRSVLALQVCRLKNYQQVVTRIIVII